MLRNESRGRSLALEYSRPREREDTYVFFDMKESAIGEAHLIYPISTQWRAFGGSFTDLESEIAGLPSMVAGSFWLQLIIENLALYAQLLPVVGSRSKIPSPDIRK